MGDKTLKLVSALSGQKIEMECPKLKESRRNSRSESTRTALPISPPKSGKGLIQDEVGTDLQHECLPDRCVLINKTIS
jgi:hypothetical protein